jgi:AcrR family transcriptional regulator
LRKQPKQTRSEQLVADILAAAAQVLARDGARRFTTARVADMAGVSIGSLYQYFPNKEAILFRLQTGEWEQTSSLLYAILADTSLPPLERLRVVVRAFFRSECEDAGMRVALDDAATLYRNAPEAHKHRLAGTRAVRDFMCEALPGVSNPKRALAAKIVTMSLLAVGKRVSEEARSPEEVDACARAVGDMFCAYLESLTATAAD